MKLTDAMQRASAAYGKGDWSEAERWCRLILSTQADYFEALNLLGIIQAQTHHMGEAVELLRRAAESRPDNAVVQNNYANILRDVGRLEASLHRYERALELKTDYAEAHNSRGSVLVMMRRFDEALASYDRALKLKDDYAEAHYNRGVVLQEIGRPDEALSSFERAIDIKPHFADAHYNRGIALEHLGRLTSALQSYDCALKAKPDFAYAHNNRGNVLRRLGRNDEALQSYERALRIEPGLGQAHYNRGKLLQDLGRLDDALDSYERGMAVKPDIDWLPGAWLHAKLWLCRWNGVGASIVEVLSRVAQHARAAQPLTVVALTDDPRLLREASAIAAEEYDGAGRSLAPIRNRSSSERIRLGYFSADYYNHATAHLAAGLFESHDRERFEVVAFSFGPDKNDAMRKRLAAGFDRFLDVRAKSDQEIVELSREMQIDIAIDLKGFTQDSRTRIFADRAAPIQINYLGYPGTMHANFMDYIMADRIVIPEDDREHYGEKVIYLPNSYQVNDRKREIADINLSRQELGLPSEGFVFCCFNGSYKITPAVFESWMRILKQSERSVLWLSAGTDTTNENLRMEARARGVDPHRLIFAPHLQPDQHLARYRAADLFLDTFPCNAHTTASDALWAGVPIVTRTGRSFASRVAASLLNAVGLPELVTATLQDYESMAVDLAGKPELIASLKDKLRDNRLTKPLFDTELSTKHIEDAYSKIYERYLSGFGPEDIYIGA
jgi:predicted O-linked N-acetylglucosamine transferase (SPINDLY family)